MSFKDLIKAEGEKTEAVLKPYKDSFKEAIDQINSNLKPVTDNNVSKEFGSFLSKALGNANGSTVAKQIQPAKGWYGHVGYRERAITGVVTGKKFGFRGQGQCNNYYIEDECGLLPGLTNAHVELIKRPSQRALARDFFMFKSAYYKVYDNIYKEFHGKSFGVLIPIDIAKLSEVSINGECTNTRITSIDDFVKGAITNISFRLPTAKWIDDSNINKSTIRFKRNLSNSYGLDTSKEVAIEFTGKVGDKEFKFSDLPLHLLSINEDTSFINNWFKAEHYGNYYKVLNMNDVINYDRIQKLIKAFINYNKGVAKTFEYLRLKYAKNLIMNGAF